MSIKISVIVPVYNVEEYLEDTIKSILNQSFVNFELILVNDGSTDKSGEICDSIKDKRIRVIHKQNGGPSDARNVGTINASGEYITWVDSDDIIHPDYLRILYKLIRKSGASISSCELMRFNEHKIPKYSQCRIIIRRKTGKSALIYMLNGKLHSTSACGLLVKKEIALKHLFPLGKLHEDDLTTFKFFMDSEKVISTSQTLYYYRQRMGSIMHKSFGKADISELDAADYIYRECSSVGEKYAKAALVKKTENYCHVFFKHDDLKQISPCTYNRVRMFVSKEFWRIITSTNIGIKDKISIILFRMGILKYIKKMISITSKNT